MLVCEVDVEVEEADEAVVALREGVRHPEPGQVVVVPVPQRAVETELLLDRYLKGQWMARFTRF